MRIPFLSSGHDKEIEKLTNELKEAKEDGAKSKDIMSKIVQVQLFRFQNTISLWKTGIDNFENEQYPTNEELIRVYNDAVLDSHLSALIQVRKEKTLSSDFKIVNDEKEEIEEESELFQTQWFRDAISFALDSVYFGHTLIEFGDRIGKNFESVSIVPREYVYQQKGLVRVAPTSDTGIRWDSGRFAPWHLGAGRVDDFGLLGKAAPSTIYKKSALGGWADFAELFGSPLRIGRTDVRDETVRNNMYNMLAEMSTSAYGVFDHEDTVEFIQASQTDAYEVFDKQVERLNSEMSKLILGSTMVIDDGSSRSQSEIHENTTNAIAKSDAVFITFWVNNDLIPFLNKYHGFNITGKFMFDDTEVIPIQEQFDRDIKLAEFYDLPAEYIREKYGVPVEEKKEVEPKKEASAGGTNEGKPLTPKHVSNSFSAVYDLCCATDLPEIPEGATEGQQQVENEVIEGIYSGEVTPLNLPIDLYTFTGTALTIGIDGGLTQAEMLGLGGIKDETLFRALSDNAFKFSAAKTFQEVKEMSAFLVDEKGDKRTFSAFKKEAKEVFKTYNKNYLRTEYDNAFNGSQMASIWAENEKEADDFPFLRYLTTGDGRVRPEHKALDNVVRPLNDPFWDKYFPPNGWNCRCTTQKKGDHWEDKVTDLENVEQIELDPNFDNNVGKTKLLFTPEHPYFIVEKQFEPFKDENFGLPTLDDLTDEKK